MSYSHLTIEERSCIYQFQNLGMSIRQIAKALKRSPSTISRELKRNSILTKNSYSSFIRYFPILANNKYKERKSRCKRKYVFSNEVLKYAELKLLNNWSPKQISNRKTPEIANVPSTSTIYRLIHKGILPKISMEKLRRKGKFSSPAEKRGKFNDGGRTIKKSQEKYIEEKKSAIGKEIR